MVYGLDPRLFTENSLTDEAERAQVHATSSFPSWRKLHRDSRFELVDRVLKAPANDLVDGCVLAL